MKPSTFLECSQSMRRGRASTLIETVLETLIRTRTGWDERRGGRASEGGREARHLQRYLLILNEGTKCTKEGNLLLSERLDNDLNLLRKMARPDMCLLDEVRLCICEIEIKWKLTIEIMPSLTYLFHEIESEPVSTG